MERTTTESIIVGAPPDRVYRICSDIESLSRRLASVRAVARTGERTSHWVAQLPGNRTVEWDLELTRLEPGRRMAWSSAVANASDEDTKTSGQITFNAMPQDQTEVTLVLKVVTADGRGDEGLSPDAEAVVHENLRSLKRSVEEAETSGPSGSAPRNPRKKRSS